MKKLFCILLLAFTGCAHITPYGHGCRDGVKGLEPELNKTFGAVLSDGDAVDRYCDAVETKNTKDSKGK